MKKYFLITIDTEGDNLWAKPKQIEVENAKHIPRFQALCEKYGFKPTYLTDYDMARCPFFIDFGKEIIETKKGEIGMHPHAWNTPPIKPITSDDFRLHPFLIQFPREIMQEKIIFLTELLESTFDVKMASHRAGSWMFNEVYAKMIMELGLKIDCSVTPNFSWSRVLGDPDNPGGVDYSEFNQDAYFLDENDIKNTGNSPLLEVPVTIVKEKQPIIDSIKTNITIKKVFEKITQKKIENVCNRLFPAVHWLRPNGKNRKRMIGITDLMKKGKIDHMEFVLHSSELMPGGSPTFRDKSDIDKLYDDLEFLFDHIHGWYVGKTLSEYYHIKHNERLAKPE